MKTYKILTISNGVLWTLNEMADRYENANNTDWKDIDDFLPSTSRIMSVKRRADSEVFAVGDLMANDNPINYLAPAKGDILISTVSANYRLGSANCKKKAAAKGKDLAKLTAAFERNTALRLENTLKKSVGANLDEFMSNFFTVLNEEKNTIYVESKRCQTEAGRRRSIGDIYLIAKYYFPDTTLSQVIQYLHVKLPAKLRGFRCSYCTTINKRVYYYDSGSPNQIYNTDTLDENGLKYGDYLALR